MKALPNRHSGDGPCGDAQRAEQLHERHAGLPIVHGAAEAASKWIVYTRERATGV